MTCTGKLYYLGVFFFFQYYDVYSEEIHTSPMVIPPALDYNQKSVKGIGYAIQQLSEGIDYVGQIFYFQRGKVIFYPDRKINGSLASFNPNGEHLYYYFNEISEEVFTIWIPTKKNIREFILGSDLNFRIVTKNQTDYTITKPLITFNHTNFIIHAAKCTTTGDMFTLLIGTKEDNKHLGIIYKIRKRTATLVKRFNDSPRDIRFNFKENAMYTINETAITKFPFDINKGTIGNGAVVFEKNKHPKLRHHTMTSLTLDRNDFLYVAAAGINGYVMKISEGNQTILTTTALPSKDLTFITFGLPPTYERVIVGSKRTNVTGYAQGAVYIISGIEAQGSPDRPIDW